LHDLGNPLVLIFSQENRMSPLGVFFKTLSRTSALFLGAAIIFLQSPFHPAAPRSLATSEISAPRPQHTIDELSSHLSASDPAVRARAACDLRDRGDNAAAAIDALVALLPDASPLERSVCRQNWWRWNPDNPTTPGEQAASALVAIGSRSFDPLIKTLRHNSWFARKNAAWALGALDDVRAVDALVPVMKDSEGAVREQVAWALGALDDRAAVPAVVDALKDASPRVRRQAAWAAGALDDYRAVDGLIAALRDADRNVREQAAWALGSIGDGRAVHALLPLLKDPEPPVRRQAAWAIGVLSK
jgi:HEAT repeat protein